MYPIPFYRPKVLYCSPPRSRYASRIGIAILFLPLCLVIAVAHAAPNATNTALPLRNHQITVRQQLAITHSSDRITGTRRDVDRFESRTVLGYASTSKLALFDVVPLVHISREIEGASDSEFGLGDAALFGRYEVFRSDQIGRTTRIAPFAGLRAPTGRDDKTGHGSLDIFGSVIVTWAARSGL